MNSKSQPKKKFDPTTTVSADYGIFGLPFSSEEARLILLPVPWEVTTSYGKGASLGPALVRRASEQIDLFDLETAKSYENGYYMAEISEVILNKNDINKNKAQEVIEMITSLSQEAQKLQALREEINHACREMSDWVYSESKRWLDQGKLLGLVGGDHSTPLGAIRAQSEKWRGDFAILHIDAHADLRKCYQGFEQSHASIMRNVMEADWAPKKLVQLGIRDFCEEEFDYIHSQEGRIKTFFDLDMKKELMEGSSWGRFCQKLLFELPERVYISFDIDGLDPRFCPNTGTPVPGGMSLDEVFYLLRVLAESGRKIIGFDLNEVSTGGLSLEEANEWDGNVGARALYKLCGWTIKTNPI